MFLRKIFSSAVSDSDSPKVPSIIINPVAQPEAEPQRGLRRTAAVSNLASLDDAPEAAMDEQFTGSTVSIARSFAAVTVSATRVERRIVPSILPMRKGYEMEEPCFLIANSFQYLHDDAEESSSDYEVTPVKNERLVVRANMQSTKNSTDPDSLEKIWNGRSSPN